ncbi:hypothetical protein JW756_06500 [Candidatus Woesearchaeota archaeon]|nr:hypothetical protein [Candidatus Woesearchaeota archaeon]
MRAQINQFFSKKPMKYSLIALCLGVWLYSGNKLYNNYKFSHPKIEQSNELIVNPSPYKRFVTKKSELEGIIDLQKIVQSPGLEEAFVYIDQGDRKGYWTETGALQTEFMGLVRKKEIHKLIKKSSKLIDYHLHRCEDIESLEARLAANIKKIEKNYPELDKAAKLKLVVSRTYRQTEYVYIMASAIPSPSDLLTMFDSSEEFYSVHPQGQIRFKIATKYGITEYGLANPLVKSLHEAKILKLSGQRKAYATGKQFQAENTIFGRNSPEPLTHDEIISTIQRMISAMSDETIKVTFTPYEDILK